MARSRVLTAAGIATLTLAASALAQFGPPPPGSAAGTESGTYGSSIGFDVRGTGTVDRFGRPYDPMNPIDTERKSVDPRDARQKPETDSNQPASRSDTGSTGRSSSAYVPGASMNPGLGTPAAGGVPPSSSPNLNPGMNPAAPGASAPAAGAGTARGSSR